MPKTKSKAKLKPRTRTDDSQTIESVYFLKLLLYVIVGSQWLFFVNDSTSARIPLPVGMLIGLLFAMHDRFKIDRKIEYAVLLVAMFVGFWAHVGVQITY